LGLARGPFGSGWSDFDRVYLDDDRDSERPWSGQAWDGWLRKKKTNEIGKAFSLGTNILNNHSKIFLNNTKKVPLQARSKKEINC
jgi:hypothetical protein